MMLGKTLLATGLVAAIGFGTSALALAHGPGGSSGNAYYGWHMCPGMMGQGMGPGMMGQGMGPGMMGQGQMGPGTMGRGMGPGMMGQGQMGPGTMGRGMGSGMMGQGQMGPGTMGQGMMQPLRRDLSAAEVQHMMEHRLSWQGNPNLKVGKVEEKDADTIVVEIVTKDESLVQKFEVDRHTGWMQPAQ